MRTHENVFNIKKKEKVLFVATVSSHIWFFMIPFIRMFKNNNYEVHVLASRDFATEQLEKEIDRFIELNMSRSPVDLKNFNELSKIKDVLTENKYKLIHTNTPIASFLVRFAARKLENTRIIYMAHGFHFFKGSSVSNWLLYYPAEKLAARWTDCLITINAEDYLAAKKFKLKKNGTVMIIPGVGVDTNAYLNIEVDKGKKLKELGIENAKYIAVSVGELYKRKNHILIINALALLKKEELIDNTFKYLICGVGPLKEKFVKLIENNDLKENVFLLGYRKDVKEILYVSDLFIFPSFREGLPKALMEAMASGLPIIATRIRGTRDLLEDGVNGILVNTKDVDDIKNHIINLMKNEDLCLIMSANNLEKIKKYDIKFIEKIMSNVYELQNTKEYIMDNSLSEI